MTATSENARQTAATRSRYNRIAPMYDAMEAFTERAAFAGWRGQLWAAVPAGRVLEVGVGTGKNLPFYPPGAQMTAIDLSDRMLARARQHAAALGVPVDLRLMDAQHLEFPDAVFDAAVATFVFCSVPDPVAGLRELVRVVRSEGDIWLLEHVRVDRPFVGLLMDLLNPLVVRVMGANINRRTVENVQQSGLKLVAVKAMRGELVRLIHARPRSG